MKINIVLICMILLASDLRAQHSMVDYTVFYSFSYLTDSLDETYSAKEAYLLFKHAGSSYFYNHNLYLNDSLIEEFEARVGPAQNHFSTFQEEVLSFAKKWSSDLRTLKHFDKGITQVIFPSTGYNRHMQVSQKLRWSLQPDKKNILGYNCQQATTEYGGRRFNAWFTTELPVNDGPYVFSGLPGLIMRLEDEQGWYRFEVQGFNLTPHQRIISPDFINPHIQEEIDREVFVRDTRRMKENPSFPPGVMNVTPEMKLNLKESYSQRNDLLLEKSD